MTATLQADACHRRGLQDELTAELKVLTMLAAAPQQVLGVTAYAWFRCASLMYAQASGGYQVMWLQVTLLPLESVICPSLTGCWLPDFAACRWSDPVASVLVGSMS